MEMNNRISGYDFIKLAFVLAVAVFLYVAFRQPALPKTVSQNSLPAFPAASFEWEYVPETEVLLNPQGVQLYRLTPDGQTWRPIIPATLSLQLPGETRVVQTNPGTWQIIDKGGALVSSWDAQNFRWVMGLIPTPTRTRTSPTVAVTATDTPTPTVSLPKVTLTATVLPTAAPTCPTDVKSFLSAGQQAQVLINLNLHSTPEMSENIFDANPAGEIVDLVQGPVCVPYQEGAYWWWELRNSEGVTGWSVEAALNGAVYFLGPLE